MANFKKGQVVYKISDWDNKGVFVFRKLLVQSCGAKRMTATDLAASEMIKTFIYPQEFYTVFPADQFASETEVAELALKLATEWMAGEIEFNKTHRVGHDAFHQPSILDRIALLESTTPVVKSYQQAREEIREQVRNAHR